MESNFDNIMDFKFTANLENELDDSCRWKKIWTNILRSFWDSLIPKVEGLLKENVRNNNDRELGKCPRTNYDVCVGISKYGPVVKMLMGKETKYASIEKTFENGIYYIRRSIKFIELPKEVR